MRKLFLIIIFGLYFVSCKNSKTLSSDTVVEKNNKYLNGSWQLQTLFASDNNWSNAPFINIDTQEKTFSGNSGCNNIRGKFTISGNYIAFDKNIISTKMACVNEGSNRDEKSFLSVLLKINKYTVTGSELELGQGDIVLMKFKKK